MLLKTDKSTIDKFIEGLIQRSPGESEFHQAVHEFLDSIIPFIRQNPRHQVQGLLERLTEPDRVISFRVAWEDDEGQIQVNRGYRVQFSNAIGPYKGGLRFHPTVNLSILKFLGFEQMFKNSLTGLPMGGAKGGSDFNPKGRSDAEVMRFCHSFMTALSRHLGPDVDVPAGDIGVGAREIGFLFGQYKRLANAFNGTFTGKAPDWGGSLIRPEATGYGAVYFLQEMMNHQADSLEGKTALVSGSGNVAQYCVEKVLDLGGKVLTLSDSTGFVHDPDGISREKLAYVMDLKNVRRGTLKEYAHEYKVDYFPGERPWKVKADFAFPCATQNELDEKDARILIRNGVRAIVEGANMPTTYEGTQLFQKAGVLFAPGKAANAGGVAVSGLEMAQNAQHMSWSREEVDRRLRGIMENIHRRCVEYGAGKDRSVNYVKGANIAGFIRVANAVAAFGVM